MAKNGVKKTAKYGEMWSDEGMCGSDGGYIFNNYNLLDSDLPLNVEHIINYVF